MDISRVPNDQKLYLCRWYFRAGFALLPFVWAINAIWFFREAFTKPPYDEQKAIRKYVILSTIGALIWAAIIITWVVMFQMHRAEWGTTGELISFIIPMGSA